MTTLDDLIVETLENMPNSNMDTAKDVLAEIEKKITELVALGKTDAAQQTNQVDQEPTLQTISDDDLAAQLRELQKQSLSKTKAARDEILAEMESRDPKTHGVIFAG